MPEFTQSWVFWFIVGIIIGFAAGFALAIIIAGSSKGSRMEEKIEKKNYLTKPGLPTLADFPIDDNEIIVIKSKDVKPYKDFDDKKDAYMVATKNNPRTD